MSVGIYADVHVPAAIPRGLRQRGVDLLTAQEDGTTQYPDEQLLDRATALGRVVFTRDKDFLAIAADRLKRGQRFAGVIYAHQLRVTIGTCVRDLELYAKTCDPGDLDNRVCHLPL